MDTIKERLSQYGKVVDCEERNETFVIKITEGFEASGTRLSDCINDVMHLCSDYQRIKSCTIKKNLFECTLVKTQES